MSNLMPTKSKFAFFFYVVESPSPVDLYHRRGEGDVLRQAINLNQIACTLRLAINLQAFEAAIRVGLPEAMEATHGSIPILHISAHGFSEGIQLSSGEIINWQDLRDLLLPLNKALNGNLIVCMSTCEGYSGSRMAMAAESEEHPFFAIVGNGSKPTWPETAVGFATFYHLVANGHFIVDAVKAMGVASGNQSFFVTTAEETRQGYLEYISNINASEVQRDLEKQAEVGEGNDLAKLLQPPPRRWRLTIP